MTVLSFSSPFKATMLVVLPKLLQGSFAALGDYFTWRLAERLYGRGSNTARATVGRQFVLERVSERQIGH